MSSLTGARVKGGHGWVVEGGGRRMECGGRRWRMEGSVVHVKDRVERECDRCSIEEEGWCQVGDTMYVRGY